MARPFSSDSAKKLISDHAAMLSQLESGLEAVQEQPQEIRTAVDALVAEEVLKVLRDTPVTELNRDKNGIRVKALQDYGYNTIADLATANVYQLKTVRGISEDAAYTICSKVRMMVDQAQKGTKIRLSLDNRTKAASELVRQIYCGINSEPFAKGFRQLMDEHKLQIEYAITELAPGTSGFQWLFTGGERKRKAIQAYNVLHELVIGDYGKKAKEYLRGFEAISQVSSQQAWNDFATNSYRYFEIIEDIAPDVLGNDDSVYGLPEDLAREIQDEAFFPDGLLCKLRRYQEWGVKYALHQERVLLGDEMGLGKTIQAIATMVSLKNTGATHFVVVCPASVVTNWCREISAKSRLRVTKVHGSASKNAAVKSWIRTGGVAVTTYETTGAFDLPEEFRFSQLVVDEAHYIKNPQARRTVNVKALCNHAERLLFMTGTALENNVDEMINLMGILQPHVALQARGYASLSAAPQFRKIVAPVYYRRKREDVLKELPEKIESKEWCSLLPGEERVYENAILNKKFAEARRVSWNAPSMDESCKARRLKEIVEEAESDGRKVIVFSFFLDTIAHVQEVLRGKCLNPINGSVPVARRQEIIDEFDSAPAGTVLTAQIQSGGTGLNIQSASVVVICEPQFKPSIENQAISRAYRMGADEERTCIPIAV